MMTEKHNFIMLMEYPNAIETEKKNIKVLSISWFNAYGVKVVKSNGSTGLQAASSEGVFGGEVGERNATR